MSNATLLRQTLFAILVCAALVALCYLFVDRPFARWIHEQHFSRFGVFQRLTWTPTLLETVSPILLALAAVRRAWGPLTRFEQTLFCAALSLIVAEAFRESLAGVFGRYWPETWVDHNPSLIGDGAYGFHPFHFGAAYQSFPSGHTARVVAFMTPFWIVYPRWRWVSVLAVASVVVGLLAMNYHFVGDVVGGGFVGAITGTYAVGFFALHCSKSSTTPNP